QLFGWVARVGPVVIVRRIVIRRVCVCWRVLAFQWLVAVRRLVAFQCFVVVRRLVALRWYSPIRRRVAFQRFIAVGQPFAFRTVVRSGWVFTPRRVVHSRRGFAAHSGWIVAIARGAVCDRIGVERVLGFWRVFVSRRVPVPRRGAHPG